MGQDAGALAHPLGRTWSCFLGLGDVPASTISLLGTLQLLLRRLPLPAGGPLHGLPHWPGHVRLLPGVSHEHPADSSSP